MLEFPLDIKGTRFGEMHKKPPLHDSFPRATCRLDCFPELRILERLDEELGYDPIIVPQRRSLDYPHEAMCAIRQEFEFNGVTKVHDWVWVPDGCLLESVDTRPKRRDTDTLSHTLLEPDANGLIFWHVYRKEAAEL